MMFKPKDMEIETTWEDENGIPGKPRLVYRPVLITSEPLLWTMLHFKGQITRTITFLAPPKFSRLVRGNQVLTWIHK